jgi:7-cyano-7-deazaguanine synthase in queuosine biosynthesis/intein/homing endonuclease
MFENLDKSKKVLLSFSGGMDSTTLLFDLINRGFTVSCISFDYGSKHNKKEISAARSICSKNLIEFKVIKLDFINKYFKSNLLKNGGDIPEGHYADDNMKATVVPNRNMILWSIIAGIAESEGAGYIAGAAHAGDHCIVETEKVFTDKGIIKIKDLVIGDKVLSFDEKEGLIYDEVVNKVNENLRDDIYEVVTEGGRSLKATSNHKFFTIERYDFHQHTGWKKRMVEKELKDLQIGDFLITPYTLQVENKINNKQIDLYQYVNHEKIDCDEDSIFFKSRKGINDQKRYIDSNSFVELLAWYITEGSSSKNCKTVRQAKHKISIAQSSTINPIYYEEINNLIEQWGYHVCRSKDSLEFLGTTTEVFWECGCYSRDKQIPDFLFGLNDNLLFNTLLKGDGCEKKDAANVSYQYSTTSEKLNDQMVWLGINLGYSVSSTYCKEKDIYILSISKDNKKKMNVFGDKEDVKIKKILSINKCEPEIVYDITVKKNHNFIAGEGSGLLVSNSIYKDCRPEFTDSLKQTIKLATDIELITPYVNITKSDIAKIGKELGIDYRKTYSCYKGKSKECGLCGTCYEKIEALHDAKLLTYHMKKHFVTLPDKFKKENNNG